MLLSKAIHLADTVTESVTTRLPAPLATPVQVAAAAVTWVPRHLVRGADKVEEQVKETVKETARPTPDPAEDLQAGGQPTAPDGTATAENEPEVVLNLDRPAEDLEPPIDVVGEALRAESADPTPAPTAGPLDDEEPHVEVEEEVVYSTSTDGS